MVRVSVLLPVRDAEPWLASSLASLARQTVADHEVIAVDDGSSDRSHDILELAARHDERLVVRRTEPRGLPAALNLALSLARAPWIARHDADDVSHRARLERQLAFAQRHPELDVIGTRLRLFPASAVGAGMRRWAAWHNALLDHESMRRELLIDSPLAHGTALIKRSRLEAIGGWREQGWAEDLDLWVRMFGAGARFGKLPQPLYGWRQHARSSTRTDVRYAWDRFRALKRAALDEGFLQGRGGATLVGVGASLTAWREVLGLRVAHALPARRPSPALRPHLRPPLVLAYMAAPARERWRGFLTQAGLTELSDFVFVA
jgi:glycosyltransferase involved in cell wall biosynthesis